MVYMPKQLHESIKVRIVADTCADFTPEIAKSLNLDVIPFTYTLDGVEYVDDIWESQTPHEFYEKLRQGAKAQTAAVALGTYCEFFTECAKEGTPTVYLCFTAGLSSSYHAACQAAQMVLEQYPEFELHVVDSCAPSATDMLLIIEAVRQRNHGLNASQLAEWANEAKNYLHGYFTLDNFDALAAGGRIPPAAASIGGKLDIKPELSFDLEGALTLKGMNRGRKKALKSILKDFSDNYSGDDILPLVIVSTDAPKEEEWIENQIRQMPGMRNVTIIHASVGPLIGSHVGPGMVGLGFWGIDRRDTISISDKIARRVRNK